MVARIRSGKSLKGAVNYNEKKVSEGKAKLIEVKHYPKAMDKLNFHEKLNRLQRLADLNARTETNCLHLSLNFDPSENLSNEKLIRIADAYMQGIGFGNQPYLVYHHHDSAHQHIHIVSTNIQKDGKRISLHNLGRTASEKVRKEIEVNFGLIKTSEGQEKKLQQLKEINLEKARYGKVETKRAVTNIVNQVISQYKFTSFPEFNAVLQQFHVTADRGTEGSRMFENKGLQYSLIDESLNKVGVPIKASSIYDKPTLATLESKFETNRIAREQYRAEIRTRIKNVLTQTADKETFTSLLRANNINVIWRTNGENFVYGVTYVDHNTKTVFNGSDLGKELSAAALRSKWEIREPGENIPPVGQAISEASPSTISPEQNLKGPNQILDMLTAPSPSFDYIPRGLKKKKKKRKGKRM